VEQLIQNGKIAFTGRIIGYKVTHLSYQVPELLQALQIIGEFPLEKDAVKEGKKLLLSFPVVEVITMRYACAHEGQCDQYDFIFLRS
jgi:hypothetical protein